MNEKSWHLDDAEEIVKTAPFTFYKPSQEVYKKLQPGNLVKLIFKFESNEEDAPGAERMWVLITEINNGRYKGTLDNDPRFIKDLKYQDEIEFEKRHIINTDIEDTVEDIVEKYIHRCLVTKAVLADKRKIKYLYREESMGELRDGIFDSGWRILAGDETQEYIDDPNNSQFVSLGLILNQDISIINLLDAPIGSVFKWNDEKLIFEKVEE